MEWYDIRDMLFGDNCFICDVKCALELASVCDHLDAVYVTQLFAGKNVDTEEEARAVFLSDNDARALCFSEMFLEIDDRDTTRIQRSAELGFAFAMAITVRETSGEKGFNFAQKAALLGERSGFHALGLCFELGDGCDQNLDTARKHYLVAAELGHVGSMICYGRLLDKSDPRCWLWLGRASARGNSAYFLINFGHQIDLFLSPESGNADVVYSIGRALRGHVDMQKGEIFGDSINFCERIKLANIGIRFYDAQLLPCRKAVDTWTLVGIRYRVIKDIRIMIGKIIWEFRDLALHTLFL